MSYWLRSHEKKLNESLGFPVNVSAGVIAKGEYNLNVENDGLVQITLEANQE